MSAPVQRGQAPFHVLPARSDWPLAPCENTLIGSEKPPLPECRRGIGDVGATSVAKGCAVSTGGAEWQAGLQPAWQYSTALSLALSTFLIVELRPELACHLLSK